MKICYFGTYEKKNQFNRIIIEGLKKNNVEVVECHGDLVDNVEDKSDVLVGNKFSFIFRLISIYFKLFLWQLKNRDYDILMAGYVGQYDIYLAKFFSLIYRKPLIFAPMVSLYDTFVEDRRKISKKSMMAKMLFMLDKNACKLADIVFLDTLEHAKYFNQEFKIPLKKFHRVWLGTNESVFCKDGQIKKTKQEKFTVLHFGKYIPLHGMEFIIDSARILQEQNNNDIEFVFIGSGQLYQECEDKVKNLNLKNVKLISFIPQEKLVEYIINADICLGVFGVTDKSSRVIPTKIYDSIVLGKTVLTRKSSATNEAFTHNDNIFFCKEGSGEEIAKNIIFLKNNPELVEKIGENAKKLYEEKFAWNVVGKDISDFLGSLVVGKKK